VSPNLLDCELGLCSNVTSRVFDLFDVLFMFGFSSRPVNPYGSILQSIDPDRPKVPD
jgi:hypothetical protein